MNKRIICLCLLIGSGLLTGLNAQNLSSRASVLKQMELANNYFMAKWPDPGADIVTDKVRPSNLWTRATYFEGLMALYYINEDETLYNYAVDWGESHNWNPTYGDLNTRDGDHQCCGQTYIELFEISNDSNWIGPIKENIDNMVDDDKADDWSWVDAIQMSMPVFAKLGVVLNDTNYFDKMYKLFSYTKYQHGDSGLYNSEEHLWWRDGNFDPPVTTPNGKNMYWSRGNGWVITALARVLNVIPENETHRDEYIANFKEMAEALIEIRREDGFWNVSLVDPDHYGGKETSGTAFFVYGLAWGINNGFLDSSTYMPHVILGWEGMVRDALHNDGFLGWVQGTGKEPKDGQPLSYTKPANFEDYGLGAFLLAGSEVFKLSPDTSYTTSSGSAMFMENALLNVYPNPVQNCLTIKYVLANESMTSLKVYNLEGELVYSIEDQHMKASGEYLLEWVPGRKDGAILLKGVYLIRLVTSNATYTKEIVII